MWDIATQTLLLNHHFQLRISENHSRAAFASTRHCLLLQEELLRHIPQVSLMQRPQLTADLQTTTASQGPYSFACTFYGIEPTSSLPTASNSNIPFVSAFESMIGVSMCFAQSLLAISGDSLPFQAVYLQSLLLVDRLVGRLASPVVISWDPPKWLSLLLECLEHEVNCDKEI